MSKVSTVTVRFYLDRDDDRRAYKFLQGRGKAEYRALSRAIIAAVDGFFSRQERLAADPYLETREKEDAFLRRIQETVEQGLQACVLGNLPALLQNGTAVMPEEDGVAREMDEGTDLDEALDFIDAL